MNEPAEGSKTLSSPPTCPPSLPAYTHGASKGKREVRYFGFLIGPTDSKGTLRVTAAEVAPGIFLLRCLLMKTDTSNSISQVSCIS